MKEHQGSTPPTEHPEPTAHEDDFQSLPNSNGEPNSVSAAPSAFDRLLKLDGVFFRTESRHLAVLAARMKVPPAEIEDVVQEVWLDAAKHREQFTGEEVEVECRLRCWLTKAVYHKAVDALRVLKRHACSALGKREEELIDAGEANRAAGAELREWLDAKLVQASRGNEVNLRLLRGHFFQGFSIKELSQHFGLTEKTGYCRICRLLESVRKFVEEDSSGSAAESASDKQILKKSKKIETARGIPALSNAYYYREKKTASSA